MINWFDMPAEGLSNGGQFEVKELEVTENGTYEEKGEMYNKVTVNVEGGGGSSDFSTAEVTLINNVVDLYDMSLAVPCVFNKEELDVSAPFPDPESDYNIDVVIYKSTPSYAYITGMPSGHFATCTGSVRVISSAGGAFSFEITGDGSITIS